jgi:hypothetical protein
LGLHCGRFGNLSELRFPHLLNAFRDSARVAEQKAAEQAFQAKGAIRFVREVLAEHKSRFGSLEQDQLRFNDVDPQDAEGAPDAEYGIEVEIGRFTASGKPPIFYFGLFLLAGLTAANIPNCRQFFHASRSASIANSKN